jgi:hypothetical protein
MAYGRIADGWRTWLMARRAVPGHRSMNLRLWAMIASVLTAAPPAAAPQDSQGPRLLPDLMIRVGQRVEQYYARARSIVCEEVVRLEPLGSDLLSDGSHVRRLVYELRVAWDAAPDGSKPPDATVLRQLVSVDGRPPRAGDEPGCLDPKPISTEPLAMLLGGRQREFAFSWRDSGRTAGRSSVTVDYKSLTPKPPDVTWAGPCVSIDLPGRTRGRVWLDRNTAEVLRLDEGLIGSVEIPLPRSQMRPGSAAAFVVECADSSIRYRQVTFHDPDEILMLPESIDSLQVIRNSGVPRLRIVQRFSNYKRFITAGRIVE